MFISVKRHELEKRELQIGNKLTEALLKTAEQGLFLLDAKGKILPQVSQSLAALFRRQDFSNLTFEKLLAPVVSAKTMTAVRNYLASALGGASRAMESDPADNPLKNLDVRLPNADGSIDTAHYCFALDPMEIPDESRLWLVRVSDVTARLQLDRELDDLRSQVQTQGEILRGVLQMGGARYGAFLQRTDASMKSINTVLKKPAREQDAFRHKLEETLNEVDRVRRDAAAFKLTALESSARQFEDALHDLRSRGSLSGSDFLPLAVKLDQLYGQFAAVKSLTSAAARVPDQNSPDLRVTESGTQVIEAPKFLFAAATKPVTGTQQVAVAGSLDGALQAMTEHVAQDEQKKVVLESHGLHLVPAKYQSAIKNVAVQLIRNAVMHGIEPAEMRTAAGKSVHGTLRLEFRQEDDHYELLFEDDGCGLNADLVRATAIARGVVTGEAAARMRDREAIKLIFRSSYTTLATSPSDKTHGMGMSLVRRYIHEAGGKIALASLPGHETRFKIVLPALPDADEEPRAQELSLIASSARG